MNRARKDLVIGIGNPDCGDDGVGSAVARSLARRLTEAEVIVRSGDMLALLEDWWGRDFVVLIDASAKGSHPGRVHRIDLAEGKLPRDALPSSTHALGAADVFALASTLDMCPGRIVVYTVEGASFAPGTGLSPAVADAVECVSERIVAEFAQARATGECEPA